MKRTKLWKGQRETLEPAKLTVIARIVIPVVLPGILAAFLLSFTLSWDEIHHCIFLGGF